MLSFTIVSRLVVHSRYFSCQLLSVTLCRRFWKAAGSPGVYLPLAPAGGLGLLLAWSRDSLVFGLCKVSFGIPCYSRTYLIVGDIVGNSWRCLCYGVDLGLRDSWCGLSDSIDLSLGNSWESDGVDLSLNLSLGLGLGLVCGDSVIFGLVLGLIVRDCVVLGLSLNLCLDFCAPDSAVLCGVDGASNAARLPALPVTATTTGLDSSSRG